MSLHLVLGDFAHSSWSMRAWLVFDRFAIPRRETLIDFAAGDVSGQLTAFAPARTVPVMVTSEGTVVQDSLAIVEELQSRHPDVGIWPADPERRALARGLAAEMHSGFAALRAECPMALRVAYAGFRPSEAVHADLRRIETIWGHARERFASDGPWLLGTWSAADAFYAPVAARIATYDLPTSMMASDYVRTHLADPGFRRFRAQGLVRGAVLPWYAKSLPERPWPGPATRSARPSDGPPENARCPYSGRPATYCLEFDGRIFGFCNRLCRDKTMADPEAWPAFMDLVNRS